jgi:hypothetical protein
MPRRQRRSEKVKLYKFLILSACGRNSSFLFLCKHHPRRLFLCLENNIKIGRKENVLKKVQEEQCGTTKVENWEKWICTK